jgi:hypothetical protein
MLSASRMTGARTISRGPSLIDPSGGCEAHLAIVQNQPQPITSDAGVNTAFVTESADFLTNLPRISSHDFASAMGEIGNCDPLGLAPVKLCSDRGVANPSASTPANNWPGDRSAITEV